MHHDPETAGRLRRASTSAIILLVMLGAVAWFVLPGFGEMEALPRIIVMVWLAAGVFLLSRLVRRIASIAADAADDITEGRAKRILREDDER
ncbi:MAG: hypothetical protein ACPGID_12435 [Rubricella sp.]